MDDNILYISIVVEDELSEEILKKIIRESGLNIVISTTYGKSGCAFIDKSINGFAQASKTIPFIILRDLDTYECPPVLINQKGPRIKHNNLLYRIAVREVESWLLADREGFAAYLEISVKKIPYPTDTISNPKQFLINLARKSRIKRIKEDIVPLQYSTAQVGRNYNNCLCAFVNNLWNIAQAKEHSESLSRTVRAISTFSPRTDH
ncbi:DUF4276 family protein [bacterium]|nr:DUF4276 family protein [bacterium]